MIEKPNQSVSVKTPHPFDRLILFLAAFIV